MDRRDFLKVLGAGAAFLGLTGGIFAKERSRRRPNIIFIMADDLGYKELGCYGQKKIETPHIDKLAVEGMRFIQYYTGSAVCAPARCNLMTGKHGGHAFVRDNFRISKTGAFEGQLPLPADTVTVAGVLKQQGYATGAFGKWGLGRVESSGDPLKQGFERFFGYNCQTHAHNLYPRYLISDREKYILEGNDRGLTGKHYAPQVIADEMLKYIKENKERPFFLYYPTVIPHLALQVPEADLKQYKGRWPETPYTGKSYLPNPTPRACYAAMISFIDRQVGRIMKLLKELGLDRDTIVFFTSDNGTTYLSEQVDYTFFESVGSLRGLKGSLYEGGIRIPMIARWPGKIKSGTVSEHLSNHYDVFATLADLVGAKGVENTDGLSFLPTLLSRDEWQKKHEYLFWDFCGYSGQLAVRMGKWKGIKRNLQKNPNAQLELYDLESDISEKYNVVRNFPDVAARIEEIMIEARSKPETKRFQFGRYKDDQA